MLLSLYRGAKRLRLKPRAAAPACENDYCGLFPHYYGSDIFNNMWLFSFGLILFFGIAIGGIIYMNTGNRLKK